MRLKATNPDDQRGRKRSVMKCRKPLWERHMRLTHKDLRSGEADGTRTRNTQIDSLVIASRKSLIGQDMRRRAKMSLPPALPN